MDTTYARAGIERSDVFATIRNLAQRHEGACTRMTGTFFRHDGFVPKDVEAPDLPAIPDLPDTYLAAIDLSNWERGLWVDAARDISPIHRKGIPTRLRNSATAAQIVVALRALESYVGRTERLAGEYHEQAEAAVAQHVAEQEGHVRTLAAIVQEARAAREDARAKQEEAAAREAAKKEQARREREEWIKEHGSTRLRRLLEEGIEHDRVYLDERLAAERLEWRYDERPLPGKASEPRNAPINALELLDEARKTAPDAQLVYWFAQRPCDCDDAETYGCQDEDQHEIRGYTCEASFLGRKIVFRVADDGTPPVVID